MFVCLFVYLFICICIIIFFEADFEMDTIFYMQVL